ncbi:MAG TPA: sulfate ABC transporter substrate-binding protein [Opitutales bacterium]|nr:sulfate ABC transporter substrate-binding protein [Opitutales bacterium]
MKISRLLALFAAAALVAASGLSAADAPPKKVQLVNVSYDPTRELYIAINDVFVKYWKGKTGQDVDISNSHGGSGAQARKVIDGLDADVVTLALAADIDAIAKAKLISPEWEKALPNHSTPYTSTIVFLVRKGNPKGIKDWDDIVKPGVSIITPNPKTSGGARWNFLAAWAYAKDKYGTEAAAQDFVKKIYAKVPVLDSGARGSTLTFAKNGQGDVLLAWENDAHLALAEFADQKLEIIIPSASILAETPVAVVDKVVDKRGTRDVALAYLKFLYTPEAQEIIAKNYYRPIDEAVLKKYADQFPKLKLATIADFGGWAAAQKKYFADGGVFDQIYTPAAK